MYSQLKIHNYLLLYFYMKIQKIFIYVACVVGLVAFQKNAIAQLPTFGKGFYRLTNDSLKNTKSLEILNDGKKDKIQMGKTGTFTGQYWQITAVKEGHYRFTTKLLGETKALALVVEDDKMLLRLVKVNSKEDGLQLWNIEPVEGKKGLYSINNVNSGPMVILTTGKNGLNLVYREPTTPSQHWQITPVNSKGK